jgi:hypothetical protein
MGIFDPAVKLQEPEDEGAEAERVRRFERFTPAPLPEDVQRDSPNRCSITAVTVAIRHGLTPARGYGLFKRKRTIGNLRGHPKWIGHWWDVTDDGRVVDASWGEPGLAYVGERLEARAVRIGGGKVEMSAHTQDGAIIDALGVYRYPPLVVVAELERIATR